MSELNTTYNTAVCNAASRKLFAPLFRARWQNCQNIVNDTAFINQMPKNYQMYYQAYITQWAQWSRGFVPQLHKQDFFSTGMGYTVCNIFVTECMSGGYRINASDPNVRDFIERWGGDELDNLLNRMFFYTNAVGNALLVLTPVNGELYPSVYPVTRAAFQIGRRGEVTQLLLFNRFVSGNKAYYTRELRVMHKGNAYYKVSLAEGELATCPVWTSRAKVKLTDDVAQQWTNCYGDIEPEKWYAMPKALNGIGVYNVRNRAVAVALSDLPGYSDSSLHTALDVLYSIDYNFTQSQVDQYLGKSRTLVPKQMGGIRMINQPGTLADGHTFKEALELRQQPLDDVFYTQIPDDNINGEAVKPMFIQPDLRGEAHKLIRDADLELLASKIGLSAATLASHLGSSGGTKTDDEVDSENSIDEKSIGNRRELASVAINKMLTDVARFYGYSEEVSIQFGRTKSNSSRENRELLADYQAGTLPLREYLRRRWSDMTEEAIEKMITEIRSEESRREEMRNNSLFGNMDFGTEVKTT